MFHLFIYTVCYREADPGQLDAYIEEVEQEGRLTGETKELLEKLDEAPKAKEQRKPMVDNLIIIYFSLLFKTVFFLIIFLFSFFSMHFLPDPPFHKI